MAATPFLVALVLIALASESNGYTEVFAASRCFSTKIIDYNNYFHPPHDGIIDGVKLYHINGTQRCGPTSNAGGVYDKWGCSRDSDGIFFESIFYLDDSMYPTLWYPTGTNTIGYQGHGVDDGPSWIDDAINNNCIPNGCGGYVWFKSTITDRDDPYIIFEQPQRMVNTSMKLLLADMQTCCEWSTGDNDGVVCVDIYLLYDHIPTMSPTTEPTTNPVTDGPTSEPTGFPSNIPTEIPTITTMSDPTNVLINEEPSGNGRVSEMKSTEQQNIEKFAQHSGNMSFQLDIYTQVLMWVVLALIVIIVSMLIFIRCKRAKRTEEKSQNKAHRQDHEHRKMEKEKDSIPKQEKEIVLVAVRSNTTKKGMIMEKAEDIGWTNGFTESDEEQSSNSIDNLYSGGTIGSSTLTGNTSTFSDPNTIRTESGMETKDTVGDEFEIRKSTSSEKETENDQIMEIDKVTVNDS